MHSMVSLNKHMCAKRQREQDAELPREKSKQAGQRAQQSPQGRGRHDVEHWLRPQRVRGNDDGSYLLRVLIMLPAAADAPANRRVKNGPEAEEVWCSSQWEAAWPRRARPVVLAGEYGTPDGARDSKGATWGVPGA